MYWIAKSTDVEKIDNILKKSAGYLRHELSQLRVIGEIPLIQFVKGIMTIIWNCFANI